MSDRRSAGELLFGAPSVHKPHANELYGGPQAFGTYRPEAANAGRGAEQYSQNALANLGQIANTGWSTADRAANQQAMRQVARNEAGQRGALMQQAQQRGTLNGGNAFLAGLLTQQQGANRNMENATNLQVAGANRRQNAAMGQAQIGQQLTQNDMARAQATDQFNQWASGMQAQAVQGQYEAQKNAADSWWHRISGGII